MTSFAALVEVASGDRHRPYPYQVRLAEEGLPDLLSVPTGAGKTLAACLPWLYRRRAHPDPGVRRMTPHWLVLVLPQRSLAEQTFDQVGEWLRRLCDAQPDEGWDGVGLHLLLGGASSDDRAWKIDPASEAVFVGTQDMVLSRLLMRGYGESRAAWPMSFGLMHCDTQFVFDEVQLMGPGLATSLQLEGLRGVFGTAAPCRSLWMSATVDCGWFSTPDFGGVRTVVGLTEEDRRGPLGVRLGAKRRIGQLAVDAKRYPADLARHVVAEHRPGTRTIVVLNTVDRAAGVFDAVVRLRPDADVVLLHSRFRPQDRHEHLRAALADPGEAGTIVVSTQVLEAGVDVSSATLITEVAPWSSIVQRAGRCNRAGEYLGEGAGLEARLLWVHPPGKDAAVPYPAGDLAGSAQALRELEGCAVTSGDLLAVGVVEERPLYPVLRQRDLIDLFDTAPDLTGNDLDVSRWIRDTDERTIGVAWRDLPGGHPSEDEPVLRREELSPVPVHQLREFLVAVGRAGAGKSGVTKAGAWAFDSVEGRWVPVNGARLRPGGMVLLDRRAGGYTPDRGWAPNSKKAVDVIGPDGRVGQQGAPGSEAADEPEDFTTDPRSSSGRPVTLVDHLADARDEVAKLLGEWSFPGLTEDQRSAAVLAGFLHDLGKAHEVFVASMARAGADPAGGPWAKSGTSRPLRHDPRVFRHELVSALMVLHPDPGLLDGAAEPDLVAYLVAAHHGKVRLSARSVPGEPDDRLLGVGPKDMTPALALPGAARVPELVLDRGLFQLGGCGSGLSWTARACRLRDRSDLGPFRLALLEAAVRVGDWRASANPGGCS